MSDKKSKGNSDDKTTEALTDDQLNDVQGGNLIDPWPKHIKGAGKDKRFFDEANARTAPGGKIVAMGDGEEI